MPIDTSEEALMNAYEIQKKTEIDGDATAMFNTSRNSIFLEKERQMHDGV